MTRRPGDRENDPFDDMFRMMERFMTEMAENMDQMMGPFGHVDFDMNREGTMPDPGESGDTTETNVDVQADDDEFRVVADVPGVTTDTIDVSCDGRTLSLSATGDRRTYSERVRLPTRVDEQSATATYNNGILEVTLSRDDTDTTIDID